MAQISFGTILRNERERKGYDLESVARRLRIRPDILKALEMSDFSRMPPRGYARNMVNAYARFLGLNPTEITGMYLEEVYADQVQKARSKAPGNGFDMSSPGRGRRPDSSRKTSTEKNPDAVLNSQGRITMTHSNTNTYSGNDYAGYGSETRSRSARPARSSALGTQYTNLYSDPQGQRGGLRSKLPLVIAGAIIFILLIILLVVVVFPSSDTSGDVQKVPVTGVNDTTQNNGGGESEDTTSSVAVAPTRAVFEYSVPSGQSAYIEIYINDVIDTAETITGPSKKSYDVTGNLVFVTTNPDGVKVTQDGTELALTDSNGVGVYSVSVDFPTILKQWNIDHPKVGASASTTASSNGTTE